MLEAGESIQCHPSNLFFYFWSKMVEESILTGGLTGPGDLPSHNVQIANLFQYMAAV
jgi:hypothetical protein